MNDESRRFFVTDSAAEDGHALRLLIRHKVHDGRLPHNRIAKISSGLGAGETCDACETAITKEQLVTEVALGGGRGARAPFHSMPYVSNSGMLRGRSLGPNCQRRRSCWQCFIPVVWSARLTIIGRSRIIRV
jgi:hypothetical protein